MSNVPTAADLLLSFAQRYGQARRSGVYAPVLELFSSNGTLCFVRIEANASSVGDEAILKALASPTLPAVLILSHVRPQSDLAAEADFTAGAQEVGGTLRVESRGGRIVRMYFRGP